MKIVSDMMIYDDNYYKISNNKFNTLQKSKLINNICDKKNTYTKAIVSNNCDVISFFFLLIQKALVNQ